MSDQPAYNDELASLRSEVVAAFDPTPDAGYGLRQLAAAWGQLAALIALSYGWPGGLLWGALYFVAMGWTQYRQYFVLHEASHRTLLPNANANRWAGRITASLLFTSFTTFTNIHMVHHRLWGTREDPGAVDYWVRFASKRQMLIFFLWPLCGLSVVEKVWTNFVEPFRCRVADSKGRTRAGETRTELVDLLYVVGVQGAVFLAISGFGVRPFDYLFFYVLPEMTTFLFLARLRMYLEHGPLDYAVSDYLGPNCRRIARTHASRLIERPLFQYMNFRFHREHHLVPSLSSAHLPEVHRRFTRKCIDPDDYADTYTESLHRIWRITSSH